MLLVLLLLGLSFAAYIFLEYHYEFWSRKGVPFIKPTLIFGNLYGMLSMRSSPAEEVRDLYNHKSAHNQPLVGIHIFGKPALLLRDPQLIKNILVRDFSLFCNRHANADSKDDPLGTQNVFFLRGSVWKEVRLKLSPFFTSSRLKNMFPLVEKVGQNLDEFLLKKTEQESMCDKTQNMIRSMEMKELCALYTTDVIATSAFAIDANSFNNPQSEFRCSGRNVFEFNWKRAFGFILVFFIPKWVSFFKFKVVPPKDTKFFRSIFNTVIRERESSGQQRNDLIDILIKHKKLSISKLSSESNSKQVVFDGDLLLAQATIFFTAGFESSSSTMALSLYELAKHENLQQRVRHEISNVLSANNGEVTQKVVDSLEYMQMVLHEVLRLYPPLPFLDRECTLPRFAGNYSLEPFNGFKMPHGMPVYIPVYALHTDPQYFADPMKFDPERFSPENKQFITPYTYMPFGAGPHGCIGERFAMIQTKVGLLHILRHYRVTTCEKTESQLTFNPKALILQAKNGIYLTFVRDELKV